MAALVPTMDDEAVETHLQLGKPWQKLDAGADLIALLRSRQGEGPKSDRDAPAILGEVMAAFAADPTKVPQQLAKWNVMDKKFLLTELLPLACKPLADQHSAEARLRQQLVHKIASNKTVPRDALMKIWSDARKGPAAPTTPAAAPPAAAPAAAPRLPLAPRRAPRTGGAPRPRAAARGARLTGRFAASGRRWQRRR